MYPINYNKYDDEVSDYDKNEQEYVYEINEDEVEDEYLDYNISDEAEWREFADDSSSKLQSRVGGPRLIGQELESTTGIKELDEKLKKVLTSPVQEFQNTSIAFLKRYLNKIILISNIDINSIILASNKLKFIKYKNPKAFVLGLCLIKNKNIDNSNIEKRKISKLDYLYEEIGKDEYINQTDILRYAFLIKNL